MLNEEMIAWLTNSRDTYEFYLLHAMLHSKSRRLTLQGVPVLPEDFRKEEYEVVAAAVNHATKVMRAVNMSLPDKPTLAFYKSYLESAGNMIGADRDVISDAMRLLVTLMDDSHKEQWYCIDLYFEAWYGSVQGKRIARRMQASDVPDVNAAISQMQKVMAAAAAASSSEEEDEMSAVMDGTDVEVETRTPTGIEGLDAVLNGGWGKHECYLLFSGTGGGKSIVAGQCAWHVALMGGWPLIVSTELRPREYVARIVSGAASIPINKLQDCANFTQIRNVVNGTPALLFKESAVEKVLSTIRERIHIAKVSPDSGLDARGTLEKERELYHTKFGRYPTWVCLDWLGSMADVSAGGKGSSERAMLWEVAANGCVAFADVTGTPTLVLAQAVNDSQLKAVLTIQDIGISKGIAKNMVAAIGLTNTMDKAGVRAAEQGSRDMPASMFLEDQLLCAAKSRKGEGNNVRVRRQFINQRFVAARADSR